MNWKQLFGEDAEKIKQLKQQQLIKLSFESKLICVTKLEDGIFGMEIFFYYFDADSYSYILFFMNASYYFFSFIEAI